MNKSLSVVAVALAAVALWAAAFKRSAPTQSPQTPTAGDLGARFDELQRDHQALQQSHSALLGRIAELERARPPVAPVPVDLSSFNQRLDQLEADQSQFKRDVDKYGVLRTLEQELTNAYAALMDTNQSVAARLKQVGQLKRYGYFDEKALAMTTDLYQQTANLNERGFVLAALQGSVPPEFRDQIIADLNADATDGYKASRFRYYAIEALEPMAQDPAVQQWLGHLAQSDPEPKLAARANQALGNTTPPRPSK